MVVSGERRLNQKLFANVPPENAREQKGDEVRKELVT
jgi:hypothetical protein